MAVWLQPKGQLVATSVPSGAGILNAQNLKDCTWPAASSNSRAGPSDTAQPPSIPTGFYQVGGARVGGRHGDAGAGKGGGLQQRA